jgi:hypothetical protein
MPKWRPGGSRGGRRRQPLARLAIEGYSRANEGTPKLLRRGSPQFVAGCSTARWRSAMSEIVDLRGRSIAIEDDELVETLARYADGTLSEAAVKSRHHLSNEDWAALGESDRLVELVEACKLRRIHSGATKRERAQIEIIDGPPILGKIMRDPNANERHRIDSIKTLDALASTGAEAAAAGARFEITINLGSDTERYSKSIEVNPNDIDPNEIDNTPVIAAITMNKSKNSDNGGHL